MIPWSTHNPRRFPDHFWFCISAPLGCTVQFSRKSSFCIRLRRFDREGVIFWLWALALLRQCRSLCGNHAYSFLSSSLFWLHQYLRQSCYRGWILVRVVERIRRSVVCMLDLVGYNFIGWFWISRSSVQSPLYPYLKDNLFCPLVLQSATTSAPFLEYPSLKEYTMVYSLSLGWISEVGLLKDREN